MSRTAGKTALILGAQDVEDLLDAVDVALASWRLHAPTSYEQTSGYQRLLSMQARLNNAARRLRGEAYGRGRAAR